MQVAWFGLLAVVAIFVVGLAAYGSSWRRGGAGAIAGRRNSARRRLFRWIVGLS